MNTIKRITIYILLTALIFFTNTLFINASTKISVSANNNKVVLGNTVTVNVTVSSSENMGSWEWVISYDTQKFKLLSGQSYVADVYQNNNTKSKTYTYKFKTISTGKGTITVKSAGIISLKEKKLIPTIGSTTINVITQDQLEESYSKDNYLKSLSVDGFKLSPTFSKKTTEYKIKANANTQKIKINAKANDSKSRISGTGEFKVSEGINKFNIIVTAEDGSRKTYTLIVDVTDPKPIKINIEDKEFTIVKRKTNLECPEDFISKEITINKQKIPAFYNEINNMTLIGLKDENDDISLYIYDAENNKYTKYTEATLNQFRIYPLPIDNSFKNDYIKTNILIDEIEFEALKIDNNSEYAIIYAKNLLSGENNYYIYDSKTNSIIRYYDSEGKDDNNEITDYQKKITQYTKIILLLGIETTIIIIILLGILFSNMKKNKKRKEQLIKEKELQMQKELQKKQNSKKKKETKKKTTDTKKNKKKGVKNEN